MTLTRLLAIVPLIALFGLILAAAPGCKKEEAPPVTGPAGATGAPGLQQAASGQQVFAANNCSNCHAINGQGGQGAPDLSKVGGARDAPWIIAHVKNPKAHKPNSRMPSFEGKINEADLASLGAYLASLR